MKSVHIVRLGRKALFIVTSCVALAFAATASAQSVYLTFSGGNGSEVIISWTTPIVYTLDASTSVSAVNPTFVFQSVTNSQAIFQTEGSVGSGAPTYTSTGAGSTDGTQTINRLSAPSSFNVVTGGDVVFYSSNDTATTYLTAGDVITLSAGSLSYDGVITTSAGYAGALPANGYYNTFIADGSNTYASNLGTGSAVPEPATDAVLASVAVLGFAAWHRRKPGTKA